MNFKTAINQQDFFDQLLQKIPQNEKLPEIVAQSLGISKHAAYRRLNGKSELSFEEAMTLGHLYDVFPLGKNKNNTVEFSKRRIIRSIEDIRNNLEDILMVIKAQLQFPKEFVYYSTKDIPVLYHFAYPQLGAFKIFTWLNSVSTVKVERPRFNPKEIEEEFSDLWKEITVYFSQLPSIEIWSEIAVINFIRQLEYYVSARLIHSKKIALEICEQYKDLFKIIEKQALYGCKLHPDVPAKQTVVPYELYFNEILVMENSALVVQPHQKIFFQAFAYFNFSTTTDQDFCNEMEFWFNCQMKKSIKLSNSREKERNQYFGKIMQELDAVMDRITNYKM